MDLLRLKFLNKIICWFKGRNWEYREEYLGVKLYECSRCGKFLKSVN